MLCAVLLCFSMVGSGRSAGGASRPHAAPAIAPEDRVDINQASLEQLLKVPGMKRTWAVRIVRFRPYNSKQDLLDKGVVPNTVFDRIREYLIAHRSKD